MLNMLSLGKTGYKKVMYRGANWIFKEYTKDGGAILSSSDKHIDDLKISENDIKFLKMGWR